MAFGLAKEGMNLFLADLDMDGLEKVKAEIEQSGAKVFSGQCDVSKYEDVQHLADLFSGCQELAGFKAKALCSHIFNAGREVESITQDELTMLLGMQNSMPTTIFTNEKKVETTGSKLIGSIRLKEEEILSKITGLIHADFNVDWAIKNQICYLKVWAKRGPIPEWTNVYAEKD